MWHHHETSICELLVRERLRRVLEIGVASGRHTRMLARTLARIDGTLTAIDPRISPWLRLRLRLAGRRDVRLLTATSLEALPRLREAGERFDCAVVDGDHNWYTVHNELLHLGALVERSGVILVHDVEWPYGRRDMYYAPERIPPEHRHPYARRGIVEGASELAPPGGGGKNADLANALHEGGRKNGVLTAVEDFIAERPAEGWRLTVVSGWNGLGILRRA